jgi:hypothetical protein
MKNTLQIILEHQRAWAKQRGLQTDAGGYTLTLEDNLFLPISRAARSEFGVGSGSELGTKQKRGKMQALHSSSALAYNVFEYWRDRPMSQLAAACGAPDNISSLCFERKFPTGLGGNPPNLDVTLTGSNSKLFAIESKFTELYLPHSASSFQDSYFRSQPGLWAQYGFTACQSLARAIAGGREVFKWLFPAQLLKHILGLAKDSHTNFTLFYLWYERPSDEAREHWAEIERFKRLLSDEVDFRSMTYNELFERLQNSAGIEAPYLTYLHERYFSV